MQHTPETLLEDVLWAVPRIYHRFTGVSEPLYRRHGLTAGKRALLQDLVVKGPHTIAEMVRVRPPVTRQYIQRLVAELKAAGLVELEADLDDRRAKVASLTEEGRAVLDMLRPFEAALVGRLAAGLEPAELAAAARVLGHIAARLETDNG